MSTGEKITKLQAENLINPYIENPEPRNENQPEPGFTTNVYFTNDIIATILKSDDCVGTEVVFAKNDEGFLTVVLVGINSKGDRIDTSYVGFGKPCPPLCDRP